MNDVVSIPRSRGAVCGVLLILLGLWGGLAPFVGHYLHFGFTPDKAWGWTSGRLYLSLIPGAATLLGGLMVLVTRNRAVGISGGVLSALGGVWLVAGDGIVTDVLKKHSISIGTPLQSANLTAALQSFLEKAGLFFGLGALIMFVAALAIGRFSLLAAQDVEEETNGYSSSYAGRSASGDTTTASYSPGS